MATVASIYSKLVLDANNFHAELDRATDGLKKFAEQATHLTTGLAGAGGLGAILTGGGIIAGFAELARSGNDAIESQVKLANVLGESTGGLSQLQHAAVMSNVSIEQFQHGMTRLQRSLGGAESSVTHNAVAFERWGLNAHELAALPLADAFERIAGRFTEIQSSSERSAMAFALFGRQGQQLIPLLSKGAAGVAELRAEADRLGLTLDEAAIQKFEQAKQASNKLAEAWRGLSQEATTLASPLLTGLSNLATRSIQAFQEHARRAGQVLREGRWTPREGQQANENEPGRASDENISRMRELERAIQEAFEKQIDVANGIDEWAKKFEEAYDAAWKLAREMDRMKPGSGDPLVAQAERLKDNFEKLKADLKEAKSDAAEEKADAERRRQRQAELDRGLQEQAERIQQLQEKAGGDIGQFKGGIGKLKELQAVGAGKDALGAGILDLIKSLPNSGSHTAGAVTRGSVEDYHERAMERMGEQGLNIQQIIEKRLAEANSLHKAQLDAAQKAADALANLGILE